MPETQIERQRLGPDVGVWQFNINVYLTKRGEQTSNASLFLQLLLRWRNSGANRSLGRVLGKLVELPQPGDMWSLCLGVV